MPNWFPRHLIVGHARIHGADPEGRLYMNQVDLYRHEKGLTERTKSGQNEMLAHPAAGRLCQTILSTRFSALL